MRTIVEHSGMGTTETKTIQQVWDHHGSYQWTYFVEEVKQYIEFFLSKRLHGKNLDMGGGWYLSYPNSDVIDISPVCLKYNLAPESRKHHFDLDLLAEGEKLPFEDTTFDSATIISSWQYLTKPWAVVKELERVLKPGSEVYIINGRNAGLEECVVGEKKARAIAEAFSKKGYDTLLEDIPFTDKSIGDFQSVCVKIPNAEKIKNRKNRVAANPGRNPGKFLNDFAEHEASLQLNKLRQLEEYPITKHAQDLLQRIEAASQEYNQKTGNIPLFFDEHSPLDFQMALTDKDQFYTLAVLRKDSKENPYHDAGPKVFREKYGLWFVDCVNYFGDSNLSAFEEALEKVPANDLSAFSNAYYSLCRFLAATKLNSFAVELGKEIEKVLLTRDVHLGEVEKERLFRLHCEAFQNKQRRSVDELIARKQEIESKPELIAGRGHLDLEGFKSYAKAEILRVKMHYSED